MSATTREYGVPLKMLALLDHLGVPALRPCALRLKASSVPAPKAELSLKLNSRSIFAAVRMWPRNRYGKRSRDKSSLTQHLNHEPQTACNTLSSNELWRGDFLGHHEPLTSVR